LEKQQPFSAGCNSTTVDDNIICYSVQQNNKQCQKLSKKKQKRAIVKQEIEKKIGVF